MNDEPGDENQREPRIWRMLALLHAARLPITDWQRHFPGRFEAVRAFLIECPGKIASTLPCPRSGQRLQVIQHGKSFAAYPEDGHEGDAEPLANLGLADVKLWRLNRESIRKALCHALNVAPATSGDAGVAGIRLLGSIGDGEHRELVFLVVAANERTAVALCAETAQRNRQRCCVVLPAFFPLCDDYLRRCEHDMIVLDEVVAFSEGGLAAKRPMPRAVLAAGCTGKADVLPVPASKGGEEESASGRLRAKRSAAGRERAVVKNRRDRTAIRAEVRRLLELGLSQTEACRQAAQQAANGRAGVHPLTTRYNLPAVTWAIVRRVYLSKW